MEYIIKIRTNATLDRILESSEVQLLKRKLERNLGLMLEIVSSYPISNDDSILKSNKTNEKQWDINRDYDPERVRVTERERSSAFGRPGMQTLEGPEYERHLKQGIERGLQGSEADIVRDNQLIIKAEQELNSPYSRNTEKRDAEKRIKEILWLNKQRIKNGEEESARWNRAEQRKKIDRQIRASYGG